MSTEESIEACPNCDSSQVYERETKPKADRYRCQNCGETFPEPRERSRRSPGSKGDATPRKKGQRKYLRTEETGETQETGTDLDWSDLQ